MADCMKINWESPPLGRPAPPASILAALELIADRIFLSGLGISSGPRSTEGRIF